VLARIEKDLPLTNRHQRFLHHYQIRRVLVWPCGFRRPASFHPNSGLVKEISIASSMTSLTGIVAAGEPFPSMFNESAQARIAISLAIRTLSYSLQLACFEDHFKCAAPHASFCRGDFIETRA